MLKLLYEMWLQNIFVKSRKCYTCIVSTVLVVVNKYFKVVGICIPLPKKKRFIYNVFFSNTDQRCPFTLLKLRIKATCFRTFRTQA